METANYFKAPWGNRLKLITALSFLALVGMPAYLYYYGLAGNQGNDLFLIVMPALFLGSALFTVRGYQMIPNTLLVQRLIWQTKIDLTDLKSVEIDPAAIKGSIRTFGNGGLFSFSGNFRNKHLGSYRAYLTDHSRSVVLNFSDHKIVISPENPQEFDRQLKQFVIIK